MFLGELLLISLNESLNQNPSQLLVFPIETQYSGPMSQLETAFGEALQTLAQFNQNTKESKSTIFLSSWQYFEKGLLKQAPMVVPSSSSTQRTMWGCPMILDLKTKLLCTVESKIKQGLNLTPTTLSTSSKVGDSLALVIFWGSSQCYIGRQSTLRLLTIYEIAAIKSAFSALITSWFLEAKSVHSSGSWSRMSSFISAISTDEVYFNCILSTLLIIFLVSGFRLLDRHSLQWLNTLEFVLRSLINFKSSFSTAPQKYWTTFSELSFSLLIDGLIPNRDNAIELVPLSLWILEHSPKSQMATGSVHYLLAQRETAGLWCFSQMLSELSTSTKFRTARFLGQMSLEMFLQNGHLRVSVLYLMSMRHFSQMVRPQLTQTLGQILLVSKLSTQISHLSADIIGIIVEITRILIQTFISDM